MDNYEYFESFIKKRNITRSNWGGYTLDIQLWEDEKSPIVNLRSIEDVSFDDLEKNGIFTDRLIGLGSSFLTKSPESGLYILAKCIMRKMSLTDITVLYYHRYLQYIDLAHNNLTNLMPLGGIPYLMYLNASYNKLIDILNFTPPWYLTYVNLSHNHITQMCDLSSFWSIVRLDLSYNEIEVIFGLHNLKYLQYLNLSYNSIEYIENLDNLNIKELNLEGNCITSYKCNEWDNGIKSLINLKTIILGYNKLSSLDFFKDACSLRFIDLKYNKIIDLLEVSNLKGSIYEIDLRGNACIKWPNYRDVILFSIPSVMFIDGIEVSIMEKISAATLFAPSLNLITARNISKLTLLEHLSTPKIDTHVIAYDKIRPPLIILTGPSAVKKRELALHISYTIPKKVKYCKWYTTKQLEIRKNEEKSFIFVKREEFNEIACCGNFLGTQELLGHSYGFRYLYYNFYIDMNEIASLIMEQKIGITQADLHTTMQICNRYLNVKPILVITNNITQHRSSIENKFDIYSWIQDSVGDLLAVNIGKHTHIKKESKSSILNFILSIIEQIIHSLELPGYSMFVRPQGTGATTTDIIYESKTMLPKVKIVQDSYTYLFTANKQKFSDLKVLLDEESNIIIHKIKPKRRKPKRILRNEISAADDINESSSSEETLLPLVILYSFLNNLLIVIIIWKEVFINLPTFICYEDNDDEKSENLKRMYVELVLKTRKIYLEHHEKNPGFFSLVVKYYKFVLSIYQY
ncbi:PREDICTED: leucine-rich repeat and guanylate kinase domain-containing protein-like [Polistes dominula]|uniref:Leucine-rich repeat and guanylate kinase domain-containing protein-like n=1 Tax=Polistes dominula TaxID=743375 RepID=A0ABM1J5B7_POLDO|nr:PREDICTED: leucine-rich repeat and guanylate kinase domain-containing protein-like [Polistes dominula]